MMNYVDNWAEIKQRFEAWWNLKGMDRPLMRIVASKREYSGNSNNNIKYENPEEYYTNIKKRVEQYKNYYKTHKFYAEAFPNFDINLGAGSMALYLGCEPIFSEDTIWFKKCVKESWHDFGPLCYNPNNLWWKRHIEMINQAKELINGDFPIGIPDIIENMDILSAMRGPQELCYDLIDEPELIFGYLKQLDELYFKYYDTIYNLVKLEDESSVYTAFQIWGPGKTAKVQCDFSAMMSPSQFKNMVVPFLREQCKKMSNSMYHLDGPGAVKHLDALLEIEELNAVQWTPGAGDPDGANEVWYPIYDKIISANKGLWIGIGEGMYDDWIDKVGKLVKRYGPHHLYILFPEMSDEEAVNLVLLAEREWK